MGVDVFEFADVVAEGRVFDAGAVADGDGGAALGDSADYEIKSASAYSLGIGIKSHTLSATYSPATPTPPPPPPTS